MQHLNAQLIQDKTVLLRMDLDVPLKDGRITDDSRLDAGLDTLDFCLEHSSSVIIMGHLGRPNGVEMHELSVKPVVDWFEERFAHINLPAGKLHILENLRFEKGEDEGELSFAKELASFGDVFVMEAFAAHHKAASTTVLPTLLPHGAGFRFAKEVEELTQVRQNPKRPLVAIIGGAKLDDKLPAVLELAKVAEAVLVGGKIALEMKLKEGINIPPNVLVGKLNEATTDIAEETTQSWGNIIHGAHEIVWNGPMGAVEDEKNDQTRKLAEMVTSSGARTIVGGGDTVAALKKWDMLEKFHFVSSGGGAMLELLITGTLPTIEALN